MLTKLAAGSVMAAVAAIAIASHSGSVSAQYPPPTGSCVFTTSVTTENAGGSVGVTVKVVDVNGSPVAGVPVQLAISHQPGTGASISGNNPTTSALGVVAGTLHVGSDGGVISLTATTGDASCSASVVVGQEAVLASVALPDTGDGASSGGDSPGILAAFLTGAMGIIALAAAFNRKGARRS